MMMLLEAASNNFFWPTVLPFYSRAPISELQPADGDGGGEGGSRSWEVIAAPLIVGAQAVYVGGGGGGGNISRPPSLN